MPSPMPRWISAVMGCAIVLGFAISDGFAQTAHEKVQPSLVFLKATAISVSGNTFSSPVESEATGFIVTEDGFILTVYHLIAKLGEFAPESLEIRGNVGKKAEEPKDPVSIVDGSPNLDMLLLKIPDFSSEDYTPVQLGDSGKVETTVELYTSGFPHGLTTILTDSGKLTSRDGPGGYLWTTDLKFGGGQSGSPIYLNSGEVVGIAKGKLENQEGVFLFIPIEFADSLLVSVRLKKLQSNTKAR